MACSLDTPTKYKDLCKQADVVIIISLANKEPEAERSQVTEK